MNSKELVYLASPYSVGLDPESSYREGDTGTAPKTLRNWRFFEACEKAAELMHQGYTVFSPIAHSHTIEIWGMYENIQTGDFWLEQDLHILGKCDRLFVYMMPFWDKSRGVAREIEYANNNNIPIEYLEYNGHLTKIKTS